MSLPAIMHYSTTEVGEVYGSWKIFSVHFVETCYGRWFSLACTDVYVRPALCHRPNLDL